MYHRNRQNDRQRRPRIERDLNRLFATFFCPKIYRGKNSFQFSVGTKDKYCDEVPNGLTIIEFSDIVSDKNQSAESVGVATASNAEHIIRQYLIPYTLSIYDAYYRMLVVNGLSYVPHQLLRRFTRLYNLLT